MRKFNAHIESYPERKSTESGQLIYSDANKEPHKSFSIEMIEDPDPDTYNSDYEDTCNLVRSLLKPKQAEMVIAICIDGVSVSEYAKKEGVSQPAISQRLQVAKKILKKYF